MTPETKPKPTGAEEIVWDLSDLYAAVDDSTIEEDIKRANEQAGKLSDAYRGKVATLDNEELYDAIVEYEGIVEMASKLASYAHLIWSTDTANPKYGALLQ